MGATRDNLLSSVFDGLIPLLRRPVQDIVYEVLDHRKVPTRADFEEIQGEVRDLQEKLRKLEAERDAGRKAVSRHEAGSAAPRARKNARKEGSDTDN